MPLLLLNDDLVPANVVRGAQFTTKSIPYPEDTEAITITRGVQSGLSIVTSTIYSGPADFQAATAGEFYDPSGAIQSVDAVVVIDPASDGSLPIVKPEDVVTYNGIGYSIILAEPWNYPPKHLELRLKRGPQAYKGPS